MKLISAPGSIEMQRAISHVYVRKIVELLLAVLDQDQDLFRDVARFLKHYDKRTLPRFREKLDALREYVYPDEEGNFKESLKIDELIKTLDVLYKQHQETLGFQRGAIVELLTIELVLERCEDGECFGNHRFVDRQRRYESDQVDVAVFSEKRQEIEGYACKMKAAGIESTDCSNLTELAEKAQEEGYDVHVGIACFDDSIVLKQRIKKFSLTMSIYAYGLDNIQKLRESPFED